MSARDAHEESGDGYFASISDLMVGILFVFLLMLTVFALNLRDSEDVSKRMFDEKVAQLEAAKQDAERAQAEASESQKKLRKAVEALKTEVRDREKARSTLLDTLKNSLKDQGVSVFVDPNSDVLRLPEDLLFDSGLATLGGKKGGAGARDALTKLSDSLAKILPCYTADPPMAMNCPPNARGLLDSVMVEGHADHSGFRDDSGHRLTTEESMERNDNLSVERALTVFREIRRRNPLDDLKNPSHFSLFAVSAFGDRRPALIGSSPEDLQKNRRIDLRFLLSSRTSDDLQRLIKEIEPVSPEP